MTRVSSEGEGGRCASEDGADDDDCCAKDGINDDCYGGGSGDCRNNDAGGDGAEELVEKKRNRGVIARVKDMLQVVSCTRTATSDGYSSIRATVQLNNDEKMQGVDEYVRLYFSFLREPQHAGEAKGDDEEVFYADADDYFQQTDDDSNAGCEQCCDFEKTSTKCEERPTKKLKRTTPTGNLAGVDDKKAVSEDVNGSEDDTQSSGQSNSRKFTPKTIVTYKVDYSVDHGKIRQLFGVDIYALGEHPSIEEAVPIVDDGEVEATDDQSIVSTEKDSEGNCDDSGACQGKTCSDAMEKTSSPFSSCDSTKDKTYNTNQMKTTDSGSEFEEIEVSDDDNPNSDENNIDGSGNGDRFGVSVNPENVVAFLEEANINLNEQTVFQFLLSFPFYEVEWDIPGFLLMSLFDDEDGEDDT
ncbi:hypothetical protein ACHAWF_006331 [Thalassiosira exigua]